jgi:hypothetical protein
MEQLDPAASVAPQAFAPVVSAKSPVLAPVMLATMLLSGAPPVLESVAAIAAEVVLTRVLGNASAGVSETIAVIPVPVRLEDCGEPVALSATDSVAAKLAAVPGVNVT